jgi:Flp pilus assembly protein TadD
VAATVIAYEPMRHNGFITLDDPVYVTMNPHVNGGLNWDSVLWAFTTFKTAEGGHWQPVTRLSHMLDCELFGLKPAWHHLTSLWFHVANTLLLFWVLEKMTDRIWPSAFVAAAFALHPLHVESVAWVTERRDMLSGFFMMLCIAAYIRHTERPSVKSYLLVCVTFALGLMSKSMLVTLPCVLLLLDYWPLKRLQLGRRSQDQNLLPAQSVNSHTRNLPGWRLILEKIPLFILAIVLCLIAVGIVRDALWGLSQLSLYARVVNGLTSYLGYIVKMFYPTRLGVLYPHPRELRIDAALLFVMGVAVLLARFARGRPWLTVGVLWYLGMLLPVIGLVQIGPQAMADRYTYLPSIGVFIIAAWGAGELSANWRYRKVGLGIVAGTVLLALLVLTRVQVQHWRSSATLYEHTLAVTKDNYFMHSNVGDELAKDGRIEEAITHFRESVRIDPTFHYAHCNLGRALLEQGKLEEAIASFNEVLRLVPKHGFAHYSVGVALTEQGKYDDAVGYFQAALQVHPDWPIPYNDLGRVYLLMGKYDLAVQNLNMALRLAPDYPAAVENLNIALQKQGKTDQTIKEQ